MATDGTIFRILNLADFHFGPYSHWYGEPGGEAAALANELGDIVQDKEEDPSFDAVVLGGDFLWGGTIKTEKFSGPYES